jgi:hypothetical protein
MGKWSFCTRCGWHSTGIFGGCPACEAKDVRHLDNDILLDAKDPLFANYEEGGERNSTGYSKEKKKAS